MKTHHQMTGDDQDYTVFRIHCATCEALLMEFVHKQVYVGKTPEPTRHYRDPSSAYFNPNFTESGYARAQSWYKPEFFVRCLDKGGAHVLLPVKDGQDRNQMVRSKGMTLEQFQEWVKDAEVPA